MFKKKLLTLAALAFCAAIVTAQTKGAAPVSSAKEATAGLIGDGAIDSLPFGNEDGKGIVFGQYKTELGRVELGWGNAFGDALWLSIYDGYTINGTSGKKDSVKKQTNIEDYGNTANSDGVNVDYTDERERDLESINGTLTVKNSFAIGVGLNNTFGIQAVWDADWANKNNVASSFGNETKTVGSATVTAKKLSGETTTITSDTANSKTGETTSEKNDKIKNFIRKNTITLNFKGAGIENDGEKTFYAKLNKIYSDLDFNTKATDYTKSTENKGVTSESITGNGINQTISINPGLEAEVGFNLPAIGVMKSTVSFTDDFNMKFDIKKNKTSYTTVTESYTTANTNASWDVSSYRKTDTVTQEYEYKPGKKLYWKNTLTPKYSMDFDLLDQLTFKAEVSAAVSLNQDNQDAGKTKISSAKTTKDFSTGNTTTNTTETVEYGDPTNTHKFETSVEPKLALGLVYQLIPGKTNINFGFAVTPGAYTWTTTETTNSNINTIYTKDAVNEYGTTTTSKNVAIASNAKESKENKFVNGTTSTEFNLGATWFFSENAKFDVFYRTTGAYLFSGNTFGVDFAVMF